jgi:3-isopropylmalate/(R)-2-methylmalate dehydratase small subunit
MSGLDDIGLTLDKQDHIDAFEAQAAQTRPWV